jgi:hypothetical protein
MRYLILISLLIFGMAHATGKTTEEFLLGYQPSKTGISFQVHSGGCTYAEDFRAQVKHGESGGVSEVTLIRIRPDTCASFIPAGIRFKLTNEQLGLAPGEDYMIMNPNGIVYGWIWE